VGCNWQTHGVAVCSVVWKLQCQKEAV